MPILLVFIIFMKSFQNIPFGKYRLDLQLPAEQDMHAQAYFALHIHSICVIGADQASILF